MSKALLRPVLKHVRSSISLARREEASLCLLHQLLPQLTEANSILSFASFAGEIDTSLINLYLARTGRLVLPKMVTNHLLHPFKVTNPHGHLVTNSLGICEPNPRLCSEIDMNSLDIILVPAIGFDSSNHRLGFGMGFYDRLLKKIPHVRTIGIGFKEQFIDRIPIQAHDVPLQKVFLF